MRIAIIIAVAAVGVSFVGMSGASAAPVSGSAIKDAATASRLMQNVRDEDHDRDHHRRHCYVRHGHRHCD